MIAALRVFWQFTRSGLRGLRSNPLTTAISVATIAVALVPVGALALVATNMDALLVDFGRDLHVTAYLEPGLDDAEALALGERAAQLDGVVQTALVSADEALERFSTRLGAGGLLEALEENPLPASLEISLDDAHRSPEGARDVAEAVGALAGVEEVLGREAWVEGYARALSLVRGAGLGLGVVLGFTALLIVANTIRLAVYSRRDELEILALVGASRSFLRVPFLVEGVLQGLCGGLVGLLLLFVGFHLAVPQVGDALELFLGWSDPAFLSSSGALALVAGGAVFGLLGAAAAVVRSPLS